MISIEFIGHIPESIPDVIAKFFFTRMTTSCLSSDQSSFKKALLYTERKLPSDAECEELTVDVKFRFV